jgi:predicted MFS family arabinose efflux permease
MKAFDRKACEAPPPHRSTWWIAAGLSVGPLVALGLARFAYALLLPAMRAELHWSYASAGIMNTANAAGYLLGALAAPRFANQFGARPLFFAGIFGTAAALAGSGATDNIFTLVCVRFAAGLLGAIALVLGASFAAAAGTGTSRDCQGHIISIYFAGAGLGIALSSVTVFALACAGAGDWRWGWLGFAAASAAAGGLAVRTMHYIEPDEPAQHPRHADVPAGPSLRAISTAYFLFGAGYISYMTFIVALLRSSDFSAGAIALFWSVLGISSIVAGFLWGGVFARLGGGLSMALVLIINAFGALMPLAIPTFASIIASAVLFGASLMAAPSAMTAFIRRARRPPEWTASIAWVTVLFGLGQCFGPVVAGYLSDSSMGIRLGFIVSIVALVLGAGVATLQQEPGAETGREDT